MRCHLTLVSAVALTQPASPVVLIFNTSDHCKLSKTSPCQILRSTASAGGIRRDTATVGDSPVFQPLRTDQYLSAAITAAPLETVAAFSLICPLHNCQFSVSHSDQIHFFAMLSLLSYSPPQEIASRCSQHHREASKSRQSILFQPASLSQCPV